MNGKTKLRLLIVGLLIAVCLVAAGFALPAENAAPPETPPLTASGNIRATIVQIASEFGGQIEAVHVDEGEHIARGEVLLVLDSATVAAQLAEAEAQVAAAQAALDVLLTSPRPAEVEAARAALRMAEAEAAGAYAQWQNALAQVENPQDIRAQWVQANTQAQLAEQGVQKAEADLARLELESGIVSGEDDPTRRQILDYQLQAQHEAIAGAQADLNAARTLAGQLAGVLNNPMHLVAQANQAEGDYRLAEQAVAVAQAELDNVLAGPTPEEIARARAELAFVQAQADIYRAQLEMFTLHSPLDGMVVERLFQPGEVASGGATLLTLADLSQLTLTVYVPAFALGRVALGQAVDVTVDSFPDRVFRGVVRRVAAEAEYTPRNVSTSDQRENLVFAVEIGLRNSDGALKPGMPADATFGPPQPAVMVRLRPADVLRERVTPSATPTQTPLPTPTPTALATPTATATPAAPCLASITGNLNVRSGPGTTYRILGTLPWPTTMEVVGRLDDSSWWLIGYEGERGWIAARYTQTEGPCDIIPVATP